MTDSQDPVLDRIDSLIATVPDFPKPGIQFKDITPLLASSEVFAETVELLAEKSRPLGADLIAAPQTKSAKPPAFITHYPMRAVLHTHHSFG